MSKLGDDMFYVEYEMENFRNLEISEKSARQRRAL